MSRQGRHVIVEGGRYSGGPARITGHDGKAWQVRTVLETHQNTDYLTVGKVP